MLGEILRRDACGVAPQDGSRGRMASLLRMTPEAEGAPRDDIRFEERGGDTPRPTSHAEGCSMAGTPPPEINANVPHANASRASRAPSARAPTSHRREAATPSGRAATPIASSTPSSPRSRHSPGPALHPEPRRARRAGRGAPTDWPHTLHRTPLSSRAGEIRRAVVFRSQDTSLPHVQTEIEDPSTRPEREVQHRERDQRRRRADADEQQGIARLRGHRVEG